MDCLAGRKCAEILFFKTVNQAAHFIQAASISDLFVRCIMGIKNKQNTMSSKVLNGNAALDYQLLNPKILFGNSGRREGIRT